MAADVIVRDEGSIVALIAQNYETRQWLSDHIDTDTSYQPWMPGTVFVEPRYVDDILHGLLDAGYEVGV